MAPELWISLDASDLGLASVSTNPSKKKRKKKSYLEFKVTDTAPKHWDMVFISRDLGDVPKQRCFKSNVQVGPGRLSRDILFMPTSKPMAHHAGPGFSKIKTIIGIMITVSATIYERFAVCQARC